jgi:CubicO group peptidase (beta-lactamase class C family)
MTTTSIGLIAAALAILPAPASAQSAQWEVLERATADVMRATRTPGVQVVVVRGDSVVYARGFGVADIETGAPMTPDLLAQVGSLTKPFTAALVLTVAQRGTLSLRAPISRVVTGLRPKFGVLTVSQLLSQTAGLGDREGSYGTSDEGALLRAARELPDSVAFLPPGLSFSYSNLGFALAGLAAQEATKQPFADLMRDRLLRPLGMTKATMRPLEAATYPRAQGHKLTAKGDSVVIVRPIADDTRIWPAGYLYTSAREASRFLIALMNQGRVGGQQAVAAGVADSMLATHVALPGMPNATRYGYGMFLDTLRGHESAWHPGSMPGFSTLVRMIPAQRVGVVAIANRDEVRMDRVAEAALEDALRPLGVPFSAPTPVAARLPQPATGVKLADYVGTYTNRFPFELRLEGGGLVLRRFGAELPVVPLGRDTFAVQAPGASTVDRFVVIPAKGARPAYGQMFLWTFPRTAR